MILPLPPAHENDPVSEILEEYLTAFEAGTAPSRDELLARHPELAAELKACLANFHLLGLADRKLAGRELAYPTAAADALSGVLGEFRIIRPIARGGMGVVYEAEQLSLGRRVALKVLPFATTLDAKQLRRFQNEAAAAAQLHHTNIVPVFAVGCDRGVHFYAMQYIDGQALDVLIHNLRQLSGLEQGDKTGTETETQLTQEATAEAAPTADVASAAPPTPAPGAALSSERSRRDGQYYRTAALLGVQAAEALAYAHAQGIVHRDIKPANLLVDVQGKLWVTDFGLARFPDGADLTLTGDLVGTLRYMSPEQALAKRVDVDHRTDIYSLGVTLYELLTLEYAFDGRDREELLRQIAFDEPRPPRVVCKAIPVELETVVLKAIRKNPAERYATAQELADDLRRFLEDRPVQARRPTSVQRLTKWSRRHRAVVATAAVLAGLAAVGSLAGNVLVLRAQREADDQRIRAEAKSELARRAVDQMYTEVAEEWLDERPHMEPLQQRFLLNALRFYEDFARENGADPEVRFQTVNASARVGRIHGAFGHVAAAEQAYEQAAELLEGLAREFPTEAKYRAAQATLYRQLSQLASLRSPPMADDLSSRALALSQELWQEAPANPAYRAELAAARHNRGLVLLNAAKYADAEKVLLEALDLHDKLAEDYPTESRHRHSLASTQHSLARVYRATARPRDEEKCYRQAGDLLEKLAAEHPTRSRHRELLATCRHDLGLVLMAKGRFTEAETALRRAGELRQQLAADYPSVPSYRSQATLSYRSLATLLLQQNRAGEAEKVYGQAVEVCRKAAADFPGQMEHAYPLVAMLHEWAVFLAGRGRARLPEARKVLDEAIVIWRKALRLEPDQTCQCPLLESLYQTLARVYIDQGDYSAAARVVAERLTPDPTSALVFCSRAGLLSRCAQAARKDRRLPEPERQAVARDYLDQGRELVGKAADRAGANPALANNLAWYLATGEEELRDPRRAVQLAQAVVKRMPQEGNYWNTLGAALYRAGEWKAAREALTKSCALRGGGDGLDWFLLAMTCQRLDDAAQARVWYNKAVAWADARRPRDPEVQRFRAEAAAVLDDGKPKSASSK